MKRNVEKQLLFVLFMKCLLMLGQIFLDKLFFIVNKITPLRVSEDKEELGLDITQHGEFL